MSDNGLPVDGVIAADIYISERDTTTAYEEAKGSLSADSAAQSADAAFKFSCQARALSIVSSDAAARAEEAADNAQNISDANTYYVTSEDPDGTIAGLAGTPDGKMFRVALKDEAGQTVIFNYYKNNGGISDFINAESSKRHLDIVLEEIIDLVGFSQLVGFDSLTGSNYIRKADGVRVPSTDWRNSTYIAVKAGQKISLTAANNNPDVANIAFYDVGQVFISADIGAAGNVTTPVYDVQVNGGSYSRNGGSGIQISKPTENLFIRGCLNVDNVDNGIGIGAQITDGIIKDNIVKGNAKGITAGMAASVDTTIVRDNIVKGNDLDLENVTNS